LLLKVADGGYTVELCELLERFVEDDSGIADGSSGSHHDCPHPEPIFKDAFTELSQDTTQQLNSAIKEARVSFIQNSRAFDIQVENFEDFGSAFTKEIGVSADCFVQIAIQLAAYRLFGQPVATYESTQVQSFRHGRTETTRSVSPVAFEFCKAMGMTPDLNREEEDGISIDSYERDKHVFALLRKAAFHHAWCKYSTSPSYCHPFLSSCQARCSLTFIVSSTPFTLYTTQQTRRKPALAWV
jgi:hypothetical protein